MRWLILIVLVAFLVTYLPGVCLVLLMGLGVLAVVGLWAWLDETIADFIREHGKDI